MFERVTKGDYENHFIKDEMDPIDYFEEIFQPRLSKEVTHVQIVDPYLNRAIHQYLFYKLCLTLRENCALEELQVYTKGTESVETFLWSKNNEVMPLQEVYSIIFDSVFYPGSHKLMLKFDCCNYVNLHDRSITFNYGRFILGRGLEMYYCWCDCRPKDHLTHGCNQYLGNVKDIDIKSLRSREHEITFLNFEEVDLNTFWLHSPISI